MFDCVWESLSDIGLPSVALTVVEKTTSSGYFQKVTNVTATYIASE